MNGVEKHDSDQAIADDERGRAASGESGSRPNKQTGA
jgi:hypothetical protein